MPFIFQGRRFFTALPPDRTRSHADRQPAPPGTQRRSPGHAALKPYSSATGSRAVGGPVFVRGVESLFDPTQGNHDSGLVVNQEPENPSILQVQNKFLCNGRIVV